MIGKKFEEILDRICGLYENYIEQRIIPTTESSNSPNSKSSQLGCPKCGYFFACRTCSEKLSQLDERTSR